MPTLLPDLAPPLLNGKSAMRNLFIASGISLLAASACTSAPAPLPDPPVLTVTSPARSLIQGAPGNVTVTGTVAPNPEGTPITGVMVNDVAATVGADGSFTATVMVEAGATLIHTEATDKAGGKADDTRSVEAGTAMTAGSMIPNAITTAISTQAFAKISTAAETLIKAEDFSTLLAPYQPMLNTGGSCLGAKAYVDSLTMTDAHISLVPVVGGMQFSIEIDGLDTHAHATYDVACIDGSDTFEITASSVTVTGTLAVTANGMMGFTSTIQNPNVDIQGLDVQASGLPGAILDLIDMNSLIASAAEKGAESFMPGMVNKVFGALGGPQKLNLLGQTIDVQVSTSAVNFTATEADITLNTMMLIEGTEKTGNFVSIGNGTPTLNANGGMQLGIASDLANELLAEVAATGLLNLKMPITGGSFDTTNISLTSPPMISADPSNGKLRLVIPDMMATLTEQGTPVGQTAINASIELTVVPTPNGQGVALQLGTPTIAVDVVTDNFANNTRLSNDDLSSATALVLDAQIKQISVLLGGIPIPALMGVQMSNLTIDGDEGYVMMSGTLQ